VHPAHSCSERARPPRYRNVPRPRDGHTAFHGLHERILWLLVNVHEHACQKKMRSRSRSRERRRRSPERDRGRRQGAERRSRSSERDRGRREGAERKSPRHRPAPSAQSAGAAVQAHWSPSDGGSRAQQPAREGAERSAEETRARKQEPPARSPRRAFQPLVPPGGLETAEQLLFGASPTLPLRCPNYANFPTLWKGQVLCSPLLDSARALLRRDATQCAGLCSGPRTLTRSLCAQLLRGGIAACHVSVHAVHYCSVPSVHDAAKRAFEAAGQLDFLCRVPISDLHQRYCTHRAELLSLQLWTMPRTFILFSGHLGDTCVHNMRPRSG
jgi:hypothetical protein